MNFLIRTSLIVYSLVIPGYLSAMEQGAQEKKFFVEDGFYRTVIINKKAEQLCKVDLGSVADIERTGEIVRAINPDYSKYTNDELITAVMDYWCDKPIPFIPYVTIYALRTVINCEKQIGKEIMHRSAFRDAALHLARHDPEHGALYLFGTAQNRFKQYLSQTDQVSFDTLRAAFSDVKLLPIWQMLINGTFSAINRKNA